MRRINAKYYQVWDSKGTDSYGQSKEPEYTDRIVECNIAMQTQVVMQEDVRFVSTHYVGLTMDKGLKVGQELRNENYKERYKITEVNEFARKVQLTLESI